MKKKKKKNIYIYIYIYIINTNEILNILFKYLYSNHQVRKFKKLMKKILKILQSKIKYPVVVMHLIQNIEIIAH